MPQHERFLRPLALERSDLTTYFERRMGVPCLLTPHAQGKAQGLLIKAIGQGGTSCLGLVVVRGSIQF